MINTALINERFPNRGRPFGLPITCGITEVDDVIVSRQTDRWLSTAHQIDRSLRASRPRHRFDPSDHVERQRRRYVMTSSSRCYSWRPPFLHVFKIIQTEREREREKRFSVCLFTRHRQLRAYFSFISLIISLGFMHKMAPVSSHLETAALK